ncbi:hypothetical protein DUNSADRAFT_1160 [Dunaliella salina]|uniref:Ribosomal protein L5 n=1 Tax=Dunaliella salina TaxID=3046 RepID=A0ABQ7GXF0_DUNSA|nr:hypothetical protein DUNSADRAFT_1160 [Dunaliella salina]|eukprot:KAF5839287.1 hypothetical protein DUNSADRAFT_1160 [Dunaliella salina]
MMVGMVRVENLKFEESFPEHVQQKGQLKPSEGLCRFLQLQQQILQREMMLKMGSMQRWQELPYLKSLTLTIDSESDTRLGAEATEKKNLMLHALALEHIAGQPAAFITHNQRSMHMASGVQVELTGAKGLDMLEKLIYLILPNQMSFEGIPSAQPVKPPPKKVPKGKPQPEEAPTKLFAVDLRVDNILLFPDLEKNFELFEPVRSMQVRISVDQAPSAEVASLYIAGFGLPLLGR